MAILHISRCTFIFPIVLSLVLVAMNGGDPVAGPRANPLPRMNCDIAGEIRADDGSCVPVDTYFSTGTNKIYWVDQRSGSDMNLGTKSKPWKTISRSTQVGILRPGDVVIIRGGTYRESIAPQEAGLAGRLITFSAYPGEETVVTGADPMNDGWTQSGNLWRHTWTQSLAAEPNAGTLAERPEFRREMVIVDGTVLKPVYSRSDVVPGTFYVEGPDVGPEAIYMRLPSDDSPSGHVVEVGYRSALFLPKGTRDDWCGGKFGFYRLVGLTFRYAVNNGSWPAVCAGAKGSILEENLVEWTNGTGIHVAGENIVLRGNRANYNGMRGIGGRCKSCLVAYNETSHNNWKQHSYGYSAGGIKLIYSTETVISHHLSVENNGTGIWLDVKNADCVVENSHVIHNIGKGILVEFGTVHTIVRNNIVYGTRMDGREGSGIQSQSASSNVFVHNTIVRNEGYGIWIRLSQRDEDGHNLIYNNLLVENAAKGLPAHSEIRIDGESMAHARTNKLDGNKFRPQREKGNTFVLTSGDSASYRGNDLVEWRRMIGGDRTSTVLDDSRPVVEDVSSYDGWRLAEGSQAVGQGVDLPKKWRVLVDIAMSVRPESKPDVGAHQLRTSARGQ